jgi:hypothetical protein
MKKSHEEKYAKQLQASREWKKRNKEKVAMYAALWREANPEYRKAKKAEWDANNVEHRKEYSKSFKTKNPDYFKRKHLQYCYGMPLEEYDRMAEHQNYCCAACGKHSSDTQRGRLFVDHDHATGEIRALLCQHCNTALGMVDDNVDVLLSLVGYLEQFRR